MANSKISKRFDQYILRGKLRQEGFERWRYVFSAVSKITGHERKFFIELYIVNPAISPKVAVISQKSRLAISEADLQYALAGSDSAAHANDEIDVKPSYVLVKAGIFGEGGKQINKFYSSAQLSYVKSTGNFKVGDCIFGSKELLGSVLVTAQELRVRPELLCNVGSMDWDLKFERTIENQPLYNRKNILWIPIGAKALFSGSVHFDNQEYVVVPKTSNGYIDKAWGGQLNSPYFHISSSKLMSIISGRQLLNSCFVLEGEFDGKLCAIIDFDGEKYIIQNKKIFKKDAIIHDCSRIVDNAEGEKVHWSVSIHNGKFVIDIDVYCKEKELFVRDYEIPQGKRSLLKVLGGIGNGEIRVYKKVRKNLELLEHANINDAVCEFGQTEEVGK
jgi:hypothetical protein